MKKCNKCDRIKKDSEFPKAGYSCKVCVREYMREYRKRNKERLAKYHRDWEKEHRKERNKYFNDRYHAERENKE